MLSCNGLKNSVKYFSTDATTSKAPVPPTSTPETQLGRYFPQLFKDYYLLHGLPQGSVGRNGENWRQESARRG